MFEFYLGKVIFFGNCILLIFSSILIIFEKNICLNFLGEVILFDFFWGGGVPAGPEKYGKRVSGASRKEANWQEGRKGEGAKASPKGPG